MLWTDGIFIKTADLMRVDAEIQDLVDNEDIKLDGNYGAIRGGIEEASQELNKMMVAYGGYLSTGDVSPNHMSAVLNIGLGNAVRYKALLSQIVVNGPTAYSWNHIKMWAVHFTLMCVYRNATNRTVKDRYESKMRYYKSELDRRLTRSVMGLGLPICIQPMSAPGATFERNAGTWGNSNVTTVAASGAVGGDFDVAITYVNQGLPDSNGNFIQDQTKYVSYLKRGNAESDGTPAQTIAVAQNFAIHVDISSLHPPDGSQDPATRILCVIIPLAATGWNVYVGPTGGDLHLQNLTPIPIATTTYTLASDPVISNIPLGVGQYADRILSMTPMRQRA